MTRTLICLLAVAASLPALDVASLPEWKRAWWPEGEAWRKATQHLRFNNEAEPETLDPHLMTGVPEGRIGMALFEGLASLHPETLAPVPGCAESWTVDESGTRWTFTLRPGLTWSDGTALTAADFVASWQRVLTPATGSRYAELLHVIRGAEAFNQGEHTDFASVGVSAPDARTVVVELAQPCPWFLELCAFETWAPVPMHVIREHGSAWTQPGKLVCNGPFVLADWRPRQEIVLLRNERYWDAAFVKLATISVLPIDEANTAYEQYQQGAIDWSPSIPAKRIDEIRNHPDYFAMPYLGTYFYRFNVTQAPFDDVHLRRALAAAIDRRVITDNILRAGQRPVTWFCPPMGPYEPSGGIAYNRDAARAHLAQSAYGPGKQPLPAIEITYNTSEAHKAIAENIAAQWREALGLTVTTRNMEWKTYLSAMNQLDYQVMRSAWIGDYHDPDTFYGCFASGGGNNRTGWSNARYDELLAASRATTDATERAGIFAEMERILLIEDPPIAPIYNYIYQGLLSERVLGFEHNLRDRHPFQYLWLEDSE